MDSTRRWHSILPLRSWFCLHRGSNIKLIFRLYSYEFINGNLKFEFEYHTTTKIEGVGSIAQGGVEPAMMPNMRVMLYMPINMIKLSKLGFTPKFIMEMDRSLKVTPLSEMAQHSETVRGYSPVPIAV